MERNIEPNQNTLLVRPRNSEEGEPDKVLAIPQWVFHALGDTLNDAMDQLMDMSGAAVDLDLPDLGRNIELTKGLVAGVLDIVLSATGMERTWKFPTANGVNMNLGAVEDAN